MTPQDFIIKWSRTTLPERAASQEHFLDLCHLLNVKTPAELDPTGDTFTFEKQVSVTAPASRGSKGEGGAADVWYKGRFGWEYKRKGKYATLDDAHRQLLQYREALQNPPLLITSDIARTVITTNFTGFATDRYEITLDSLTDPGQLNLLKRAFTDPLSFRPDLTAEQVTERASKNIGATAQALQARGHDPHTTAHFLMKCMFCLFAEDIDLLPDKLFEQILTKAHDDPERLTKQLDTIFNAMRTGGDFGTTEIPHFNGGLFDNSPAIPLTRQEANHLKQAAEKAWEDVEPSIFGTLFERSLDPEKRAQIGAHYTSREDIMLVIEPVITRPLRREFDKLQEDVAKQLDRRAKAKTEDTKRKANNAIDDLIDAFQQRLSTVTVLDPACGSGNFLYVAIQQLLDLEKELITFAATVSTASLIPKVSPKQLKGIEINPYAAELAQVVIWIGYLQWLHHNGFNTIRKPILDAFDNIENRDAILQWQDNSGKLLPTYEPGATCKGQAPWPNADFIVGNPPFLGAKLLRASGLADEYVEALASNYSISKESDLCGYWFDRASDQLRSSSALRGGLLATQAIRNLSNRKPLERIIEHGSIVEAWSDREWMLDGASVQVSIVCFANDQEDSPILDGTQVPSIHADLSSGIDLLNVPRLDENDGIYIRSPEKGGNFDISHEVATQLLAQPCPNGKPPSDVLSRWINANGLSKKRDSNWIIDFHEQPDLASAAGYAPVFAYAQEHATKSKAKNRTPKLREKWWQFRRSGEGVRRAQGSMPRILGSPMTSKFRLFAWIDSSIQPDKTLPCFARSDDYFLGVLHAAPHELWALRQGTQLEDRPRYTPTTCFETFPLPFPPSAEPDESHPYRPLHDAIASAAEALNTQRERWLNPPEWISEVAAQVDAEDTFDDVAKVSGEHARQLIRQSAIDARAAKHPKLKKRTLTNLYNERPTWLQLAHEALDQAVINAYAHTHKDPPNPWNPTDWPTLFKQTGPGQPLPDNHELTEQRQIAEQAILENLLHLNHQRANNH